MSCRDLCPRTEASEAASSGNDHGDGNVFTQPAQNQNDSKRFGFSGVDLNSLLRRIARKKPSKRCFDIFSSGISKKTGKYGYIAEGLPPPSVDTVLSVMQSPAWRDRQCEKVNIFLSQDQKTIHKVSCTDAHGKCSAASQPVPLIMKYSNLRAGYKKGQSNGGVYEVLSTDDISGAHLPVKTFPYPVGLQCGAAAACTTCADCRCAAPTKDSATTRILPLSAGKYPGVCTTTAATTTESLNENFEAYDEANDGAESLKMKFKAYDEDGDGLISFEEWEAHA